MHGLLRSRWLSTLAGYGVAEEPASAVFTIIEAAYAEPQRHYHTLSHLQGMFQVLDGLAERAADRPALELAVWLHDLVYDPARSDNEARSAEVGAAMLRDLGLPQSAIAHVSALVLATAHHQAGHEADAGLLIDADLAILAARPGEYQAYSQAIRREYAHLPDAVYRAGRAAVLQSFLSRDHVYQTALMRRRAERRARNNLTAELAALQIGKPGSEQ